MTIKRNIFATAVVLLIGSMGVHCLDARASSFDVMNADAYYQEGHYQEALEQLKEAAKDAPNDAAIQYKMGLCLQHLHQLGVASQKFKWVAMYAPDASLRAKASNALSAMIRAKETIASSNGGSSQFVPAVKPLELEKPSGGAPGIANGVAAKPPAPVAANNPIAVIANEDAPKITGRLKIIEFYTDW